MPWFSSWPARSGGFRSIAFVVAMMCGAAVGARAQTIGPAASNGQGPPPGDSVAQAVQPVPASTEPLPQVVRDVLVRYGSFIDDATYGEVWVPNVTPPGWHPYPPCHWVKAKRWGLYYDDQSDWGRIVHHFGRWVHGDARGWMWVSGNEFSPGWVVWRSNATWTGWAPLPPSAEESFTADIMAGADSWLFQETPRLLAGCMADQIALPARVDALLVDTPYLSRVGFWSDIAVFIVPAWIVGPFIQVDASFRPWSHEFTAVIATEWNFVWHHTTVKTVKNVCLPKPPKRI